MRRVVISLMTFVFIATMSFAQAGTQSTSQPSSVPTGQQAVPSQTVPPAANSTPNSTQPSSQPCNCPCANQSGGGTTQATPSTQPGTYNSNNPSQNTGIGSNTQWTPVQNNTTSSAQTSAGSTAQQPQQAQIPQQPQQPEQPQQSQQPQQPITSPANPNPRSIYGTDRVGDNPQNTGRNPQETPTLGRREPPPTHIPMARTVPVGAEVDATLDTSLSSKSSQEGQPFTATLTQPLRNLDGVVLIPIGSKVRGQVGSVESGKTLPSIRGKGQLTLRFTDLQLPDGTTVPFTASLLGVHDAKGGKPANTTEEGQVTGKTSGTGSAKDVGIGAGLGTVAGLIFGSALKGLAIGAIAGGGYVLANGGKDVELPADTGLRLRVDQNITLPANTGPR